MDGRRWVRKSSRDAEVDACSPLPLQVISNEEYVPLKQAYLDEGPRPSLTQYGWVLEG
jgi:hypothetical protein